MKLIKIKKSTKIVIIVIKSKNQLWDENKKLEEERNFYKGMNNQYEGMYKREKDNYLICLLNKVF